MARRAPISVGRRTMPAPLVALVRRSTSTSEPRTKLGAVVATVARRLVPNCSAAVVAKTGMVVISDLVDNVADIHPANKQDVGLRLARLALANDYGMSDLATSGPMFKSAKAEGGALRITFDGLHGGLVSRDGKLLTDFQIAGKDQKFTAAEAKIDGDSVVVRSSEVAEPVAVRFAWTERSMPNLANKAGLPANSFRTDSWQLVDDRPPAAPAPAAAKTPAKPEPAKK